VRVLNGLDPHKYSNAFLINRVLDLKVCNIYFCAGQSWLTALPQISQGRPTLLNRLPSWISGGNISQQGRGGGEKRKKGRKERIEGEGEELGRVGPS